MRKEILNGTPIPYDLPFGDLKNMLFSDSMTNFCLACEALSYREDDKSYQAIKEFIKHQDKYRRLYAIKTIFRHPASSELQYVLEEALSSDDPLFINAACDIIAEKEFDVSESKLRLAVKSNSANLSAHSLHSLKVLAPNEENYVFLLALFQKSSHCLEQEILGELLMSKYLPEKSENLFQKFCLSKFPAIRILAVEIGQKYGYDLSELCSDNDGHVRKAANKAGN